MAQKDLKRFKRNQNGLERPKKDLKGTRMAQTDLKGFKRKYNGLERPKKI